MTYRLVASCTLCGVHVHTDCADPDYLRASSHGIHHFHTFKCPAPLVFLFQHYLDGQWQDTVEKYPSVSKLEPEKHPCQICKKAIPVGIGVCIECWDRRP